MLEKENSTEWMLTFRRFSKNDEGCYVVKAINNIGSDTKSWNILVASEARNKRTNSNSYQDAPKENQIIHEEGSSLTSINNSIQEGIKVNHVYVFFICTVLSTVTCSENLYQLNDCLYNNTFLYGE